jgi:hypothetical protein
MQDLTVKALCNIRYKWNVLVLHNLNNYIMIVTTFKAMEIYEVNI